MPSIRRPFVRKPAPQRGREIELDFIRGLAILMVLDYHSPSRWMSRPLSVLGFPSIGWIGVDIFFVLSGFLVGCLLVKEHKCTGQVDAKRFLIRRMFKVWPQYYLYLGVILLSGHRTLRSLWSNFLNVQNYAGGIPHTWSLAVEEHAYLLLAAFFVLVSWAQLPIKVLLWTSATLSAFIVVGRIVLIESGYEVVTLTHTRIEGILYGVMLAIIYHHAPERFMAWQRAKWLWVGGVIGAFLYLRFESARPWAQSLGWDMANLIGICLLMLLYRPKHLKKTRSRPYRIVAWIGIYSYGIYLWHVSVLAPTAALANTLPIWLRAAWLGAAPIIAGVAIGAIFTRIVELPTLQLRDRWFPKRFEAPIGIPSAVRADSYVHTVTHTTDPWTMPKRDDRSELATR